MEISFIKLRQSMCTVQVVAVEILALKVANASRRPKDKTERVSYVGGLGLGPDMAIVPFTHAFHRPSLGLGGGRTNWRENKHSSTIKMWREVRDFVNSQFGVISFLHNAFATRHYRELL